MSLNSFWNENEMTFPGQNQKMSFSEWVQTHSEWENENDETSLNSFRESHFVENEMEMSFARHPDGATISPPCHLQEGQ